MSASPFNNLYIQIQPPTLRAARAKPVVPKTVDAMGEGKVWPQESQVEEAVTHRLAGGPLKQPGLLLVATRCGLTVQCDLNDERGNRPIESTGIPGAGHRCPACFPPRTRKVN